ncbi:MAG: hypothetical protein Q7O66_07335 [Dehalococcoidia bacterium]|nr:hypothetical protein [Dehalococcoidia bacterium]
MSPVVSKSQWNFMKSVAEGTRKAKGLTKKQAQEYIDGQNPADLPERIGPKKSGEDLIKQGLRAHNKGQHG